MPGRPTKFVSTRTPVMEITVGHWTLFDQNAINVRQIIFFIYCIKKKKIIALCSDIMSKHLHVIDLALILGCLHP